MRLGPRTPAPRHLAGRQRPADRPADFDVEAALTDPDFDFDALFDDEDADAEPAPRARVGRHRVAFAVSVTLAALPLLVLDNLPATAGTDADEAVESTEPTEPVDLDPSDASSRAIAHLRGADLDATVETPTTAAVTVFVEDPTTTTEAQASPAPSTTEAAPEPEAPTTTAPRPTTTTTTAPAPRPTAPPAPPTTTAPAARTTAAPDPADPATWDRLAKCESGGNWAANTGNGYYGGLQFSLPSWQSVGGTGYPHQHSRATQIEMGKRLYARAGWNAWPSCARKLGWS